MRLICRQLIIIKQDQINKISIAYTAQKMKFSIKDFFSICDQIRSFLRIWSHLLKNSLMENFVFCAVLKQRKNYKCFPSHL